MKKSTRQYFGFSIFVTLVALSALSVLLIAQSNTASPPPDWVTGDVFVGVGSGSYQVWHSANPTASNPSYSMVNEISDSSASGRTAGCGFDLAYRFFGTNFDQSLVDRYAIDNEHPVQQTLNGAPSLNSQSVAFDGAANVFIGYAGGVTNQGTIERWTKDTTQTSPTFGQYIRNGSWQVPVDNTHGPGWIDLAKDGHTIFYTSQGPNIRTFDTASVNPNPPAIYATVLNATLFALRILPPGDGTGGVLVAAQSNVLLVKGASVTKFNVFGNDNDLEALSLDSSVSTRAWAGDASRNDFILFDYVSGKKVASFNTGTGTAGPLGGICVDGSYSRAEAAAVQVAPPVVKTLSPSTQQNPTANTISFTSPFTGATFTDTFADLSTTIQVTVRDSLVDASLALSDPTMFSFNPGNPVSGSPLPGNMICDNALTAATNHPGTCELFEVEANPNSGYTITNIQIEPPAMIGLATFTDLPNLRLLRNLDEDLTDNVDISGTKSGKCVYTTNQQISNSAFQVCSGTTFASPASGTALSKNQTSTITFKFQVAPTGTCPNGASQSPPACSSTSGTPCLSPLLMVVQLQPGGLAPVRIPVHVAGNSGGIPLFVLSGNTWQLQVKTDDMPAGFTYVATMVDLGAGIIPGGVQNPDGTITTSSVTIPYVFSVFTLK